MENFYKGNLNEDREKSLGHEGEEWLIGDFQKFSDDDLRKTKLLELKYWKSREGAGHPTKIQKSAGEITIIKRGWIKGFIGEKDITLTEGDYVYIPPSVVNNLVIEKSDDAEVLTIKSPSDKSDIIKILRIK